MPTSLSRAFRFCPSCGAGVTVGRNPLRCASCGFVYYFSPIAAVVGIIATRAGEVLFLVRAKSPGKGKLGLPGGFVDAGESAEEALAREVREEINLTVTGSRYLGSFANRYVYRGVQIPVMDAIYACEVETLEGLERDPGEIADVVCRVPGPAELARMAFDSNRRGLELYLQEFTAARRPGSRGTSGRRHKGD